MKLGRFQHQICQVQSGGAYSFKERGLMGECWNQRHNFSIVSMITVLKFIKEFEYKLKFDIFL